MRDLTEFYKGVEASHGKAVADGVRELCAIYGDSIYKWLAGLWDREVGGFYYSVSARDNEEYVGADGTFKLLPDIESTSQAFCSLEEDGIVEGMASFPKNMKDKAVKFITGCQDPEDGYFYHKQWGKKINTSRRARDMSKGVSLVKAFGGRPIYPTAIERIAEITKNGGGDTEKSTVPEHLRTKAAFVSYLESLEINKDSYSVGHCIGAQVAEIRAAGLADVCYDFLCSTQFDNGLWQPELSYRSSNGLMKISCAFRSLGRPMPNMLKSFSAAVDIACDSTLEMSDGITCVYNPPFTMLNLFATMKDVGDDENYKLSKKVLAERAPEILIKTADKVKLYAEPDGSFSYRIGHPAVVSQGMRVCIPNLPESDVNANALAQGARTMTLKALDIPVPKLCDERDSKIFFELCGESFT